VSHLWESKHRYYCTEGQYFGNSGQQTVWEFKSWADFMAEMSDADMDYNMLFRWDWSEENEETGEATFNGDPYYRNGKLKLFFMIQRKGFHSCSIIDVCRADEPAVIEYLKPRLAHLMSLWEPLSVATNRRGGD
jgi:hypothetical protein